MGYKYEKELVNKAGGFINLLNKNGYISGVTMTRDYMLKLEIIRNDNNYGNAVIYYKPSKNSFSLKTHELHDEEIRKEIEEIWDTAYSIPRNFKDSKVYEIYVDGSYMTECVGYGFVVIKNNKIIEEEAGPVNDPLYTESHQVGGEIKAVERAVAWAEEKGIKEIIIYYDLANLEKWITGEYEARNPMTQKYRDKIRKSSINIKWQKVESHTGNRWNEYADQLAKDGTGN